MKWIGSRISFVDHSNKTTIVIEPEKNFWINMMMGAWLAMWYVVGFTLIWAFYTLILSQQEQIIVIVSLVFWLYYASRVTKSFLWLQYGKEKIKMDEVGIHIKKSIANYGKSIIYYHENIKQISIIFPEPNSIQSVWESSPWINGGERIYFDYLSKQIRFGKKINQKDATILLNVLIKRSRQFIKK
jgi:hypothetical protein